MLVSALVGAAVLFRSRGALPKPGATVEVVITLTPDDRTALDCALAEPIDELRCAYSHPGEGWVPTPAPRDILTPVVTTDHVLYLAGGIFEEPVIRTRLERMVSGGRLTARCQLQLATEVPSFQVRFGDGTWRPEARPAWAARVRSCRLQ